MKRLVYVFLGVILLSGCTGYSDMRESIEKGNKRVELVMDRYEKSKVEAIRLESTVRNALTEEKTDLLKGAINSEEAEKVLLESIEYMDEAIKSYLLFYEEESNRREQNFRLNREELVENTLEGYNFLDGKTGRTEQLFLLQLPTGFIFSFSVIRDGGEFIDIKTSRDN